MRAKNKFFFILICACYVFTSIAMPVFADSSLPASERQALKTWPDWVGCANPLVAQPTQVSSNGAPVINAGYDGNKINPSSTIINDLLSAQTATKVPASVLLAQGAQESGNAGWWDQSKMDDTKTVKYSYFNNGGGHNLNEEYQSYDNNPNGHGPMQLDNWPGSYGPSTGNYTDARFATFAKDAQAQFGASDSLNPKKIGNIAMMWDTSILYAAIIDADILQQQGKSPASANTADWASVLATYGTLAGASADRVNNWEHFRDSIAKNLDNASSSTSSVPTSTGGGNCCLSGSSANDGNTNSSGGSSTPSTQPSVSLPSNFSQKDKAAQLLFIGLSGSESSEASEAASLEKTYNIGGFLFNTAPSSKSTTDSVINAGGVKPFIALDEEGGEVERLGVLPQSAKQMGSMSDDDVKQLGQTAGQKMAGLDIDVDFAPVLDLDNGKDDGAISKFDRSFSSNSNTVTEKAGAFADGLGSASVVPTFKHFPGLGSATTSTDDGPATTKPLSSLEQNDLKPYDKLLTNNSRAMVMVGNQIVPGQGGTNGQPASLSKSMYDLLRGKYGFSGIAITDDLGHAKAISSTGRSKAQAAADAIKAGADMALVDVDNPSEVGPIVDAVSGSVDQSQINSSANKIVSFKNNGQSQSTNTAAPTCACPSSSGTSDASLTGSSNAEKAFNYFTGKGVSAAGAAGIVGNMQQESTPALSTSIGNINGGPYGIGQWTSGRLDSLKAAAGSNLNSLSAQLDFAWSELNGSYKSNTLDPIMSINDPVQAADIVFNNYEVAGDNSGPRREAFAQNLFNQYGKGAAAGNPASGSSSSGGSCSSSGSSTNSPNGNGWDLTGPNAMV
jgi:beta-N-acetylhexosaminidase